MIRSTEVREETMEDLENRMYNNDSRLKEEVEVSILKNINLENKSRKNPFVESHTQHHAKIISKAKSINLKNPSWITDSW